MRFPRGFLLLIVAAASFSTARASDVSLQDDAYHYPSFRDGQNDLNYVEWWYFNLSDASRGIQVALTYSIQDPENLSGIGTAGIVVFAYTPAGAFHETAFLPADAFSASTEQADVRVAQNTVEVIDADTYHIVGAIEGEHRVMWDLTYVRQTHSWFGGDREKVGLFPWEQMSWLVYMPGAYVSGKLVIDGDVYFLSDTPGYHDHNWGEWLLTTVVWNWGQFFEPGFSLELGDFYERPVGVLRVDFQGVETVFEKNQYRILHTGWRWDKEHGVFYPTKTWLMASNGHRALAVLIRSLETQSLLPPPYVPFLFLKPILYEQRARYTGSLWERSNRGRWELVRLFRGDGFKEYATRVCAFCGF